MKKVYPSWRYHRTLSPHLVKDDAEDLALGGDWADTPAAFQEDAPKVPTPSALTDTPKRRGRKPRVEAETGEESGA